MTRITACLAGMICLAGTLWAEPAEYEINLVRNAGFKPGMDRQGPKDWIVFEPKATNIVDAGRGYVEFFDGGMTIAGPARLMQFDIWGDVTPGYKFVCGLKSEGAKGCVVRLRTRNRSVAGTADFTLSNSKLGAWEDFDMTVTPTNHCGVCMDISVPVNAKLSISNLRVTAVFPPAPTRGTVTFGGAAARGICLPHDANWVEQLAAHELQVNLYLVSGVRLPVFAGDGMTEGNGCIRIKNLKKMIPDIPPPRPVKRWWHVFTGAPRAPAADPEANGFRITCAGGNVDLIGGNDAGVLAGAMHLSELCGAKFYAPKVFAITVNHALKIPAMDISRQPAFEWTTGPNVSEHTYSGWKYGYIHPDSTVAPSDMADPPMPGWVHPSWFLAPPYLYAESHPDYYAFVKGKRFVEVTNKQQSLSLGLLNLCLGNPELQQVVAERIVRLMDMYPHTKYFSIAQGDGLGWCECKLCTALDVDENILTDRLIAYANAVAAITSKIYPDRKLVILAYAKGREDLPLREKLHPNVAVQYALWPSSWPIWAATVCEQNKRGLKLLDDWNALTGTNLTLFMYPVNTRENADKIKLAAAKGIRGFNQCGVRGDFPEIMIYTTGRLIWDPDADVEKMVDEIIPQIYGAAAPEMRRYFDMHHRFIYDIVADPEKYRKYFEGNRHRIRRMPLDCAEKALGLLEQAEKAAGNDEYVLKKIHTEKYRILYAYINDFMAVHPGIPEDQFEGYARKMAELVKLARECREPFAGYNVAFSEWLYQTTGVLDFNREPYKWFADKKIDAFLADPVNILKTRVYLQTEIEDGIELPAKAWLGTHYYEKYQGQPAAVIRRRSSSESRVKTYFKLERAPAGPVKLELQGLDNEKEEIAEIEITINGETVFAGPVEYPKNKWGLKIYEVPSGILKQGENIIAIQNTMGDYKDVAGGEAGPAEEALAAQYNWGWCMVGRARLIWNAK